MTTITLEVPDELAARLDAVRAQLPDLLSQVLEKSPTATPSLALQMAATHPAYRQMMDFLATSPTRQQMVDFQISASAQKRLEELLDKNREEGLTEAESAELDVYELVHHSVIRLKAHGRSSYNTMWSVSSDTDE
jgi:hypothetical protein